MSHGKFAFTATAAACLLLGGLWTQPAAAQSDIFGFWGHMGDFVGYTAGGPPLGDFEFLPLNADGRARAESWDPGNQEQPLRQCFPHSAAWIPFGPTPLLISDHGDYLQMRMQSNEVLRTIWMDGRPHPSASALHTWNGFSTGEWQGNTLKITTTHMKEGFVRRNGVPNSERAVVSEYLTRHDDYMTDVVVLDDPVYFAQPLVREQSYRRLSDETEFIPYPCASRWPMELGPEPFHFTRHYLPGQNPVLQGGRIREDTFGDDAEEQNLRYLLDDAETGRGGRRPR